MKDRSSTFIASFVRLLLLPALLFCDVISMPFDVGSVDDDSLEVTISETQWL